MTLKEYLKNQDEDKIFKDMKRAVGVENANALMSIYQALSNSAKMPIGICRIMLEDNHSKISEKLGKAIVTNFIGGLAFDVAKGDTDLAISLLKKAIEEMTRFEKIAIEKSFKGDESVERKDV